MQIETSHPLPTQTRGQRITDEKRGPELIRQLSWFHSLTLDHIRLPERSRLTRRRSYANLATCGGGVASAPLAQCVGSDGG